MALEIRDNAREIERARGEVIGLVALDRDARYTGNLTTLSLNGKTVPRS